MTKTPNPLAPVDKLCNIPHTPVRGGLAVLKTTEFESWLVHLPPKTRTNVIARLDMLSIGHFGDHKRFDGLIELRWKNGTRVYAFLWDSKIVVTLYGGNKNGQNRDIKKAQKIRKEILAGARPVHEP